ncbi:MAG: OmpA family protein [Desulfobacterales bacterium]|jgi:general secretion pathway protein A
MYLNHYNLKRKPFEMSPDPRFLWLGEKHKEALAALEYGILESKGFLLLTGDAGTGKTVLINSLLKSTRVKAIIATIPDPDLEILDFFNVLAEEFQMNKTYETKGNFLIEFKRFLHEVYQSEGKVLLIIDECQRLNHRLLEQIRILSNIELNDRKLINIFFVGQSEFNEIVREERNAAVRKRLAVSYNLVPLDRKETETYIEHRLKIAGATENLFTPEAMRDIFFFCGGLPRLINITCDHALLIGYSKELKKIDDSVIAECRRDLQILSDTDKHPEENERFEENKEIYEISEPPDEVHDSRKVWLYAGFILALIIFGYLAFNFDWRSPSVVNAKEKIPALEDGGSEKESPKSEDVTQSDVDSEKVPEKDQEPSKTDLAKLDETSEKDALSEIEDDRQTSDHASSEDTLLSAQNKKVIHFKHNSMQLSDEAYEVLGQIVNFSASNPALKIIVEGYTDSLGHPVYNKNLSKMRAEVIKKYLVDKGILAAKIETVGMGPENPIASNETFEGRKLNRRIEIRFKVK